jgi:hypothetical protein
MFLARCLRFDRADVVFVLISVKTHRVKNIKRYRVCFFNLENLAINLLLKIVILDSKVFMEGGMILMFEL